MAAQTVLQSRLKLPDPELALLCAPAKYVDCRHPSTRLPNVDSGDVSEPMLLTLRMTGGARAYNADNDVYSEGGRVLNTLADLQALGYGKWKNFKRIELDLEDDRGQIAFLGDFAPQTWRTRVVHDPMMNFIGKVKRFGQHLYVSADLVPPQHAIGRVWARYAGIASQVAADRVTEAVRAVIGNERAYLKAEREIISVLQLDEAQVLSNVQSDLDELGPDARTVRFGSLRALLKGLHEPETVEEGERALLLAQRVAATGVRATARFQSVRHRHPDAPLIVPDDQVRALAATLPEKLTADQMAAALGIAKAMRSPIPMNGLLSGDVGTGKTLSFLIPAIVAHNNGATVAIVAPTFILANQIAGQIAERFGNQIRGVERVGTGKKVRNPDHILVGTSGLTTSCAKSGVVPNLVVLDEQHKLSVATRNALVGPATHVLEATATPIPRSLATVFFDSMQVFGLNQAPVHRQITTHVIEAKDRSIASRAMRQAVAEGRRVLIVYPRVDTIEIKKKAKESKESEELEQISLEDEKPAEESTRSAQGVLEAAAAIETMFPGKVAVLHGMMSDGEKESVIEDVKSLRKPVLVASVIVETGIDIPDIGMLLIRDANHLGMSQLHQLRGRLARKGGQADCFFMVESLDDLEETALERLYAVRSTTDGYLLAELDLRQRGFGSYVDDGQSGATRGVFRLVNLAPEDLLDGEQARENLGRSEEMAKKADKALRTVAAEIQQMKQTRGAAPPVAAAAPAPSPARAPTLPPPRAAGNVVRFPSPAPTRATGFGRPPAVPGAPAQQPGAVADPRHSTHQAQGPRGFTVRPAAADTARAPAAPQTQTPAAVPPAAAPSATALPHQTRAGFGSFRPTPPPPGHGIRPTAPAQPGGHVPAPTPAPSPAPAASASPRRGFGSLMGATATQPGLFEASVEDEADGDAGVSAPRG